MQPASAPGEGQQHGHDLPWSLAAVQSLKNRDMDTLHPEEGVVVDAAPLADGDAAAQLLDTCGARRQSPRTRRPAGTSSAPAACRPGAWRRTGARRPTRADRRARSTGMKKLHVREQLRHGLLGRCCRAGLGDVVERHHRSCLCRRRPGAEEVLQRVGVTEQRRWRLRRAQRNVEEQRRLERAAHPRARGDCGVVEGGGMASRSSGVGQDGV